MPRPKFESVDEYIASFPKDVQIRLKEVRSLIRQEIPNADREV